MYVWIREGIEIKDEGIDNDAFGHWLICVIINTKEWDKIRENFKHIKNERKKKWWCCISLLIVITYYQIN